MSRSVAITAYGSEEDRRKLEVIAKVYKSTSSGCVIDYIRSTYKDLYGDTNPKDVLDGPKDKR